RVFGLTDASVRALGALAGALTVVPLYALGRSLFDRPTGALAALLLAVNPYHVWYSQEVRMHALAVLSTALSLYAFWRLLRGGRLPWWLAHLFFTTLTFYMQSYVVFLVVAENLFVLGYLWAAHGSPFSRAGWSWLRLWLLEQALTLVLMLPGAYILQVKMLELRQWDWLSGAYGRPGLMQVTSLLADWVLGFDFPGGRALLWSVLLLVGALAAWGVWQRWRTSAALERGRPGRSGTALALVLTCLAVPLALVFVLGQFTALWVTRYLLPFLPLLLLLAALGIRELPRALGWLPAVALVAVSAYALAAMVTTPQKEDWRGLAQRMTPQVTEADVIVLMDDECRVPFNHYFGRGGRRIGISRFANDMALDAAIASLGRLNRGGRLWLVVSHADSAALETLLQALPWLSEPHETALVGIRLIEFEMQPTGSSAAP
ncbi:MAG: hypothetical protein GX557_03925, partial [Chloroflexi bacterium]|nr:hypothetical protein [Chloroflexota bacterium]